MILKGSEVRKADYPIDTLFLDRWSPRAISGEPIDVRELMTLFEAARWAPSSGNSQPWRFVWARRDTEHWPAFFDFLNEGNRTWCHRAAALVVLVSRKTSDKSGRPLITHSYDTGAAWMSMALQGRLMGLVVHGMAGFDYEKARAVLGVPDDLHVNAMAAIGRPGAKDDLPPQHLEREFPNSRHPLSDLTFEGRYQPGLSPA